MSVSKNKTINESELVHVHLLNMGFAKIDALNIYVFERLSDQTVVSIDQSEATTFKGVVDALGFTFFSPSASAPQKRLAQALAQDLMVRSMNGCKIPKKTAKAI
ncbi:MAG: hypothetical protein EBU90_26145 [Proteobacteria bacterium]|nr:hypothetical protein [Pseudomonadota bacterium]